MVAEAEAAWREMAAHGIQPSVHTLAAMADGRCITCLANCTLVVGVRVPDEQTCGIWEVIGGVAIVVLKRGDVYA